MKHEKIASTFRYEAGTRITELPTRRKDLEHPKEHRKKGG